MPQSPTVETRIDQPYAAIPVKVSMDELGSVVPPLTGQVFDWLADRGIRPAGPPFWRYVVVDMDADLELETGVAVASAVDGDERIRTGVLPGGRYATVVHKGHPDTLVSATRDLLDWAAQRGLEWDANGDDMGLPTGGVPQRSCRGAGHERVADQIGVPAARLGQRSTFCVRTSEADADPSRRNSETPLCMKLPCMAYSCG